MLNKIPVGDELEGWFLKTVGKPVGGTVDALYINCDGLTPDELTVSQANAGEVISAKDARIAELEALVAASGKK